jgi:hypothetical protein
VTIVFDAATGEWAGEPSVLAESVRRLESQGNAAFSTSRTGVLVFDEGSPVRAETELVWIDRDGKTLGTFASESGVHALSLAADDRRVVVELLNRGVWILDDRGGRTRLSTEQRGLQGHPVWSPDMRRVVYFDGTPGADTRLLVKDVTSTRPPGELVSGVPHATRQPTDWSRDGRIVLFEERSPGGGRDLKYVEVDRGGEPRAIVQTPFSEQLAAHQGQRTCLTAVSAYKLPSRRSLLQVGITHVFARATRSPSVQLRRSSSSTCRRELHQRCETNGRRASGGAAPIDQS